MYAMIIMMNDPCFFWEESESEWLGLPPIQHAATAASAENTKLHTSGS